MSHTESDYRSFNAKETRLVYRTALFDTASAELLAGLREQRGMLLLTGEAGVGKTLLLRQCMAEAPDIDFVSLPRASLDFPDILNYLCASLELPADYLDAGQQSRLLLEALAACARRRRIVALLIDDAHQLRTGVLRRLHDFVETPALPTQRLQVVLAGQPELEGKLRQPELHRLQAGLTVRCRLAPLNSAEAVRFVNHQFETARYWNGELPSTAVVERILQYSQGVPRTIALLCDALLLFAGLDLDSQLTPAAVDEAAKSCFLNESLPPPSVSGAPATPPPAAPVPFSLDFPDLGLDFDLDLEETLKTDAGPGPEFEAPLSAGIEALEESAVPAPPSAAPPVARREPPPALREFTQLLDEAAAKQERMTRRERETLDYFRNHYRQLLASDDPGPAAACARRLARLQDVQQPVQLSLAAAASPQLDEGVLCALLINPTWWLYREIRLRVHSAELAFAQDGQAAPVRLLDGRDAQPVYLPWRRLPPDLSTATLWLELELCDHRGEWSAWASRQEVRLNLTGSGDQRSTTGGEPDHDRFWPDARGEWSACAWPLDLEERPEQTRYLRAAVEHTLNRGTLLTRAVLLADDPALAPARIEVTSRPLMVFGRQSAAGGPGFGDFTLGFTPKYHRISRLHCVVSALGDQLALMAASDQGHTCTGRNGRRLTPGGWESLADGDLLDICDLYRLRLFMAWDRHGQQEPLDWDPQEPRQRFGRYLLDLVEVLRQRDQQADDPELRANLRKRYLHLLHTQERVAELNGIGKPGTLLYAGFERDDHASRQIAHYYVPKWLPMGSGPEDGLRLTAPEVRPHHVELLFRDGMYWIQNMAADGSVRVGCHGLATNETLALAAGDTLAIGAATFRFEGY